MRGTSNLRGNLVTFSTIILRALQTAGQVWESGFYVEKFILGANNVVCHTGPRFYLLFNGSDFSRYERKVRVTWSSSNQQRLDVHNATTLLTTLRYMILSALSSSVSQCQKNLRRCRIHQNNCTHQLQPTEVLKWSVIRRLQYLNFIRRWFHYWAAGSCFSDMSQFFFTNYSSLS